MSNTIEDIAGVHLGQSTTYATDIVDNRLLVGIPRELNRDKHNIHGDSFTGVDIWHAYEFSTLHPNGVPLTGILRIVYGSDTPNIVESKSLKLYLNGFNMCKHHSADYREVIANDLQTVLGTTKVDVTLHQSPHEGIPAISEMMGSMKQKIVTLEKRITIPEFRLTEFKKNSDLLGSSPHHARDESTWYHTSLLRSNCRVTNQPDWGDVYINYNGGVGLHIDSLLKYIVSFRNENHFHEEVCELIFNDLRNKLQRNGDSVLPNTKLAVICRYTRRGGIDINPVRHTANMQPSELTTITSINSRAWRQ